MSTLQFVTVVEKWPVDGINTSSVSTADCEVVFPYLSGFLGKRKGSSSFRVPLSPL
nr:MAG TPA: Endonuclease V [Caudoviricetes sp.]